jgi:hypothetical protein
VAGNFAEESVVSYLHYFFFPLEDNSDKQKRLFKRLYCDLMKEEIANKNYVFKQV